ncbi:flavin monoamine oxidase family protein [Streptomyces sp. AC495_CC817]|uniref:flavin monoamine oxidase family protein n=1 Tax=Streptomyces sp. AC495_CC817 TaxID=2823900 RepID=UPI0020B68E38|nr:flavin monoamine oxidase family protein [Streptomyces sp. AC495_CC817]
MATASITHLDRDDLDVIIIGAGFAGLTAATRLSEQGRSVLVLEGRDHVGGRSYSGEVAGVTVDLGATWVAERHEAVLDLARSVGCTTTPQYHHGDNLLTMHGERVVWSGAMPLSGPVDAEDVARVLEEFSTLVETIDVDAAWDSPRARELDAISFGAWLDTLEAGVSTRALMAVVARVQWGCSPGDVSLLHALRYVRAGGGLEHMLAVEGGQQQDRIAGGSQQIATRLAERLGERVVLGAVVEAIVQDEERGTVTVRTSLGDATAPYVISTTAPAHRIDIDFQPDLPPQGQGLARTWTMGSLSKAFVAYDRPFWRKDGLSGESIIDGGTFFITFDVSPSDDGPGVLMTFCDDRLYDAFTPEDRRDRVVRQLVELYGAQAAQPVDYVDHCWGTDSFAPGGPNPSIAPFAMTSYGPALAEPHGRIHWAGSETAGAWAGTLNGAVLTGRRAADAISELLGATTGV